MKPPPATPPPPPAGSPPPPEADDPPGVPGFRTWRGVYLFVLAVFAAIVIGLTLFTRLHA